MSIADQLALHATESTEEPGCEEMTDGEVGSLEHPSELEVNRQVHRL